MSDARTIVAKSAYSLSGIFDTMGEAKCPRTASTAGGVTHGGYSMSTPDATMQACPQCGRDLPAAAFGAPPSDSRRAVCKECKREYQRRYRAAHPEKTAARQQRFREAHGEKLAAKSLAYYHSNTEERKAYKHSYNQSHIEARAAYARSYQITHAEQIALRTAAYAKAHPEQRAAKGRNRAARKRSAIGSHTAADIKAQYDRQKGKCYYCGVKVGKSYHVDHVTPLVRGGSNGPENLVIACPTCNLSKGAKHPMDFCGRLV